MTHSFTEFSTNASFSLGGIELISNSSKAEILNNFTFIQTKKETAQFVIDGIPVSMEPYQVLSLTANQTIEVIKPVSLIVYQFNKEFYCIKDHDKEVGCVGLLFFGNVQTPIVSLDEKEQKSFHLLHQIFIEELKNKDNIQAEMLRTLMARFIIKTTRIFKASQNISLSTPSKSDLLRSFNLLVEDHFKKEHSVGFYANALFKSPKTLSNAFAKLGTTPLKIIHERIILEAKRMLLYSDKTTKEIAYSLGFDDASHLSRLFKKITQHSPTHFRENSRLVPEGKN